MVSHWSLSDSKSPQVSGTLLSILAVLNNAVIWMVSPSPLTSKSSRPFNNPLVAVSRAPITIGTIVTFILHSFFSSLARSRYYYYYPITNNTNSNTDTINFILLLLLLSIFLLLTFII